MLLVTRGFLTLLLGAPRGLIEADRAGTLQRRRDRGSHGEFDLVEWDVVDVVELGGPLVEYLPNEERRPSIWFCGDLVFIHTHTNDER